LKRLKNPATYNSQRNWKAWTPRARCQPHADGFRCVGSEALTGICWPLLRTKNMTHFVSPTLHIRSENTRRRSRQFTQKKELLFRLIMKESRRRPFELTNLEIRSRLGFGKSVIDRLLKCLEQEQRIIRSTSTKKIIEEDGAPGFRKQRRIYFISERSVEELAQLLPAALKTLRSRTRFKHTDSVYKVDHDALSSLLRCTNVSGRHNQLGGALALARLQGWLSVPMQLDGHDADRFVELKANHPRAELPTETTVQHPGLEHLCEELLRFIPDQVQLQDFSASYFATVMPFARPLPDLEEAVRYLLRQGLAYAYSMKEMRILTRTKIANFGLPPAPTMREALLFLADRVPLTLTFSQIEGVLGHVHKAQSLREAAMKITEAKSVRSGKRRVFHRADMAVELPLWEPVQWVSAYLAVREKELRGLESVYVAPADVCLMIWSHRLRANPKVKPPPIRVAQILEAAGELRGRASNAWELLNLVAERILANVVAEVGQYIAIYWSNSFLQRDQQDSARRLASKYMPAEKLAAWDSADKHHASLLSVQLAAQALIQREVPKWKPRDLAA